MADQVQQAAGGGAISYLQGSMIICKLVPGYQEARQAGAGVVMLMLVPGNQQALMPVLGAVGVAAQMPVACKSAAVWLCSLPH